MTDRMQWQTSMSVYLNVFSRERMAELQRAGISFMELTGADLPSFGSFSRDIRGIFGTAAAHGVKIRSVHLPFCPFDTMDPASFQKVHRDFFVEQQGNLVKAAADAGIEIAVVHPSGEPYREAEREERLKCSIDSLDRLNRIAGEAGVRLAVENLPRTCMGRNIQEMVRIGEELPEIFYCFDANHSLVDGNPEFIRALGQRIVALHISDYDRINERHLFPGEGINDWKAIMSALEQVNYRGTWNYEIKDTQNIPAAAFRENHRKLLAGLL